MNFLTLADVKSSRALTRISGVCPTSDDFLAYVNEATERLMTRGDWASTLVPIQVCVSNGCVTWPRYVGSVRKMRLCGNAIPVVNLYANFLDRGLWPRWYSWAGLGTWSSLWNNYRGIGNGISGANKVGAYSTYNDPLTTSFIRAYPQFPQDIGKTVTIFGKDENGQPLVHKVTDSDGVVTYHPGTVITIGSSGDPQQWGSTSVMVQPPIDRVIKDETVGRVWLYSYDPTTTLLFDLAVYEPGETNPTYERMRIPGVNWSTDDTNTKTVMAMVKLQFIPAKYDTDLILIPNIAALKTMMQAIAFEDANDDDRATRYEARAIRELNLMLRDLYPEDQTAIEVDCFNGAGIGMQSNF